MVVDSALAREILELQALTDRLETELDAMYLQPQPSLEALQAKTKEYMAAYKALNDVALQSITARD